MFTGSYDHPGLVRATHWINAAATIVMILSGWRIYNAAPLFDFTFPRQWTIGGWLAGALQWHLAAMWVLVANGLIYLAHALYSGRLFDRLRLPTWIALVRDIRAAARGKLSHAVGKYNAIQRCAYLGAIGNLALLVVSGLVVWKPVQVQAIGVLLGDYEGARLVHFFAMCALVLFLAGHVSMALLVPESLKAVVWPGKGAKEAKT